MDTYYMTNFMLHPVLHPVEIVRCGTGSVQDFITQIPAGYPIWKQVNSTLVEVAQFPPKWEGWKLERTSSTVPDAWDLGLDQEYQELGQGLSQMVKLQEESLED